MKKSSENTLKILASGKAIRVDIIAAKNISLEGVVYEGREFSCSDTYFDDLEQAEEQGRIKKMLSELTEIQRRRCVQLAKGMSMQEIARQEGCCSVRP